MKCDITERDVKPREDLTREALAEEAECTDPGDEICCNEKEIIQVQEDMTCLEIAHKGFRYCKNKRLTTQSGEKGFNPQYF